MFVALHVSVHKKKTEERSTADWRRAVEIQRKVYMFDQKISFLYNE